MRHRLGLSHTATALFSSPRHSRILGEHRRMRQSLSD